MAFEKLILKPGISTLSTPTLSEGGWNAGNLIRWLNGYLQKIGGWQQLTSFLMPGITRALHAFQDLDSNKYLALGSSNALEILWGTTLYNITPIRATTNPANAFTTTITSASVKVTDTANGTSTGDLVDILVPVAIGGLVLRGDYAVATVIDADNYTIIAASPATSNAGPGGATPQYVTTNTSTSVTVNLTNHGRAIGEVWTVHVSTTVGGLTLLGDYSIIGINTVNQFVIQSPGAATSGASAFENSDNARIIYYLAAGPASDMPSVGYGAGAYGAGPYGTGSGGSAVTPLRNWALDNFGENLLAVPTNGALYEWIPPVTVNPSADLVSAAPSINWDMLVTMPSAQVFLLGSETGGNQDPLLVRWCDNGDYTDWTATSANQAGSYRLSRGSRIVGGIQAPQAVAIWTDTDLWTAQYSGYPFIWNFQQVQSGAGLWAQKGRAVLSRNTYWISNKGFFVFGDGGIQPIPCDVWDQIFADIDIANLDKTFAAPNSLFNEVMWFFPQASAGTGEISAYVKYTVVGGLWDYGALVRTAWIDLSLLGPPVAVDSGGMIFQHEIGSDDNGTAMTDVEAVSGYADVASGEQFLFIDHLIPDIYMTGSNPSVQITIYATNYPGEPATAFGPFTVTPSTTYITLRTRARQLAVKIECDSLGTFWRIGAIRYRGAPAGRV